MRGLAVLVEVVRVSERAARTHEEHDHRDQRGGGPALHRSSFEIVGIDEGLGHLVGGLFVSLMRHGSSTSSVALKDSEV
jgi:hypothetical protein